MPGNSPATCSTSKSEIVAIIDTKRLRMRPFKPDDAAALARLYGDDVVMRYMLPAKGLATPAAENRAKANIANFNQHWRQRGFGIWALETKPDGRLVGQCGLRFIENVGQVEILYLLNKTLWGRGLATEAAQATLQYGFVTHELSRIIGLTRPENLSSRRVLEKIGLTFERYGEELWNTRLAWHGLSRETWALTQAFTPVTPPP